MQNIVYKMPNINNECLRMEKKNIKKYLEVLNQDVLNRMLRNKINNVFYEEGVKKMEIELLMNKLGQQLGMKEKEMVSLMRLQMILS